MSIKVYTQAEVDAILPDAKGFRHFPTGDYSAIMKFDDLCEFEGFCVFSKNCKFGEECEFGDLCVFSSFCVFGEGCSFGKNCKFAEECSFGIWGSFNNSCKFGTECKFGEFCDFNNSCKFGEKCRFSTDCIFGLGCTFEDGHIAKTTLPFITLAGVGSEARTCYFYDFEKGIHVRAGCFFGTLEEFKAKVLEDEKTPETPSKKTKNVIAFCSIAETQFSEG